MNKNLNITAEEFRMTKKLDSSKIWSENDIMIEFAKLKVELALSKAAENAKVNGYWYNGEFITSKVLEVDKNSIIDGFDKNEIR